MVISMSWNGSIFSSISPFVFLPAIYGAWLLFRVLRFLTQPHRSPLRFINGPPGASALFGSLPELMNGKSYPSLSRWKEQYGHVFVFRGMFGGYRCVPTDNKAIAHILSNNMIYYKSDATRFQLSFIIGNGLISAEGMEHRHQRKIMTPAFSSSHLRDILPTFLTKSAELRDTLLQQLTMTSTQDPPRISNPANKVDILRYLYLTTLDIMGLAGFNYAFNALRDGEDGNELSTALGRLNSPKNASIMMIIKGVIPPLRSFRLDSHARLAGELRGIFRRIGMRLIDERQREISAENATSNRIESEKGGEKDLLSLMIRSNMSNSVPTEQRLSVEQILQQIPTFLIAGHETTASSMAWGLFAISTRPVIQSRLRAELLQAFPDDSTPVTLEALNQLKYLDAVVREILRYHPAVEIGLREAQTDDIIPLDKVFVGRDGKFRDHIEVKKGDQFVIPIMVINRMKQLWGKDADEFNPGRWLQKLPPATSAIPGAWSNLMTFLGGPRSCIGLKFAILEMKVLLLYLIRTFEFELAVPPEDIIRQELIVTRPIVKSEVEKGPQMPMIIRLVKN